MRRRGDQLQKAPVKATAVSEQALERARAAQAVARFGGARRVCNAGQTESRARPFARRAARTLRPPTVLMRARKP